jgi:hypothetical protein
LIVAVAFLVSFLLSSLSDEQLKAKINKMVTTFLVLNKGRIA